MSEQSVSVAEAKKHLSELHVNILPLDLDEVLIAGDTLAFLQKIGQPIGIENVLIASTALNHECTLVSANIRHFTKISGLTVEDWLVPF